MEGTLDNAVTMNRSSFRPIIPSRNFDVQPKKIDTPTVEAAVIQSAEPRQRFSKLTPIYAPTKVVSPRRVKRTQRVGIEFVKPEQSAKKQVITQPATENLEFVETNLDMIDLDLVNGAINDQVSVPASVQLIASPTQTPVSMIEQYFHTQSHVPQKQHRFKKNLRNTIARPRNIARLLILLIIISAIGLWAYDASGVSYKQAHALAPLGTVLTPPPSASSNAIDKINNTPKTLIITKLGINASIESIATTTNGAMGVPTNIWDAGWYSGSAEPGQAGAVFVDGHSSSTGGALFGKLGTLAVGDQIGIVRNDGVTINYSVSKVSIVNRNDVDMASLLKPYDGHTNGLNILSCEGKWINSEDTLENRVMVYAVQI